MYSSRIAIILRARNKKYRKKKRKKTSDGESTKNSFVRAARLKI